MNYSESLFFFIYARFCYQNNEDNGFLWIFYCYHDVTDMNDEHTMYIYEVHENLAVDLVAAIRPPPDTTRRRRRRRRRGGGSLMSGMLSLRLSLGYIVYYSSIRCIKRVYNGRPYYHIFHCIGRGRRRLRAASTANRLTKQQTNELMEWVCNLHCVRLNSSI